MPNGQVWFESHFRADGTFGSTMHAGDRVCDLAEVSGAIGKLGWDARRETPLDALLRSGLFAKLLSEVDSEGGGKGEALPAAARTAAPLVRPGKILALGRTYRDHALELGNAPPAEPLVFEKLPDSIAGTDAVVAIPPHAGGRIDHEAELGLVIGTPAWRLPDGNGRRAIAAVVAANDLTLRGVQKAAQKAGHPWLLAKSFPGACVLGPRLLPAAAERDLDRLLITCRVNGAVRQQASTGSLMRPVGALVEWLSQYFPLHPGDLILTGTPAGTGPLQSGDVCEITITGDQVDLGTLVTRIE
jgi:2-keto-4-pentenoate hydratase/2-oxohepta-3-ene-1,7-dioic acid hydratase in catechol pathway